MEVKSKLINLPKEINVSDYEDIQVYWHIDNLRNHFANKEPIKFVIEDIFSDEYTINERHASLTKREEPIIVLKHNDGHYEVIDGKHRLTKVKSKGLMTIDGHCLKEDEADPFIIEIRNLI